MGFLELKLATLTRSASERGTALAGVSGSCGEVPAGTALSGVSITFAVAKNG